MNNQVKKELKFATFVYNEDTKDFGIQIKTPDDFGDNHSIVLSKVYAFAFMRFLIRISSRNWFRKQKKVIKGGEQNE